MIVVFVRAKTRNFVKTNKLAGNVALIHHDLRTAKECAWNCLRTFASLNWSVFWLNDEHTGLFPEYSLSLHRILAFQAFFQRKSDKCLSGKWFVSHQCPTEAPSKGCCLKLPIFSHSMCLQHVYMCILQQRYRVTICSVYRISMNRLTVFTKAAESRPDFTWPILIKNEISCYRLKLYTGQSHPLYHDPIATAPWVLVSFTIETLFP